MTSNIGQEEFSQKASQIGFDISESEEDKVLDDYEQAKKNIIENLTDYFSPEFINRIDKIVVFNPLDKKNIKKIVKLQLERLEERLENVGIHIQFDAKSLNLITKEVYNPEFGAREIRRYITDMIEDQIAEKILLSSQKKSFEIETEKSELVVR